MKGLNSKSLWRDKEYNEVTDEVCPWFSSRRKWVSLNSLFSLQEIPSSLPSSLMNASFKRRKFLMQRQREGFMREELNEVRTVFERRGLNEREDVEVNQDFMSQWKGKVLEMRTDIKNQDSFDTWYKPESVSPPLFFECMIPNVLWFFVTKRVHGFLLSVSSSSADECDDHEREALSHYILPASFSFCSLLSFSHFQEHHLPVSLSRNFNINWNI